jgi:hypothetical protein
MHLLGGRHSVDHMDLTTIKIAAKELGAKP